MRSGSHLVTAVLFVFLPTLPFVCFGWRVVPLKCSCLAASNANDAAHLGDMLIAHIDMLNIIGFAAGGAN